ncbi:MAG: hypothetical protein IKB03_00520 [Tidjanibacter sp.]|nr:hypothetical protein [Tidjanibacter sp.]
MMKKLLLALIVMVYSTHLSFADEQIRVTLSDTTNLPTVVEFANYNIILELMEIQNNGRVKIRVDIDNTDESLGVLIFNDLYAEKMLKKKPHRIYYDKHFGGTKNHRMTDNCAIDTILHVAPQKRDVVMIIDGEDGKQTPSLRIPVYIAKYQDRDCIFGPKHKRILMQKDVLELIVDVDLKPTQDYLDIVEECDNMVAEFDRQFFCTNPNHKPSLEEQKAQFQEQVDALVAKIDSIITYYSKEMDLYSSDKRYAMYEEQRVRIDSFDLTTKEGDCGKHVVRHSCVYCNMSLRKIAHEMEDIYQSIYTSPDRNTAKNKHIKKVNAMYNCAKKYHKDWNKSQYRDTIIKYYEGISKL